MHYINEKWNLCSNVLDTTEITTEHTAVNLSVELKESLAKWDLIEEKLVAVTTDNARNIVNAIELLHWQHFGCFAHTLQLGVKKAMELTPVAKALGRGRNLAGHFHHSTKSSYLLNKSKQICIQMS